MKIAGERKHLASADRRRVWVGSAIAVGMVVVFLLVVPGRRQLADTAEGAALRVAQTVPRMLSDGASDRRIMAVVQASAAADGGQFVADARDALTHLRATVKGPVQLYLAAMADRVTDLSARKAQVVIWMRRSVATEQGSREDSLLETWDMTQVGRRWLVSAETTTDGPQPGSPLTGPLDGFKGVKT